MNSPCEKSDLLVFSHLRWDFVFQRPQHLLSRHAKHRRVYYFEEPVFGMTEVPRLHLRESQEKVQIVVPYLPSGIKSDELEHSLKELVNELVAEEEICDYTIWYYTPMALNFSKHLKPSAIIFDCMDELSLFKDAPQALIDRERELMKVADVVFTGGQSLYEAKKHAHRNIHPFPSSIDFTHFSQGRLNLVEPDDQVNIPHPRIGFYGVIDERFDVKLLEKMADLRQEFHFIIVGPVLKIDPSSLPVRSNIHYLGKKEYHALPLYLASWDCAMMPFALNDSTRFISPTKTPEFLAAGKPVVSTAIDDVVHPYSDAKLVYIANEAQAFIDCIQIAMNERAYDPEWMERVDAFLDGNSWDSTFAKMAEHESSAIKTKNGSRRVPVYKDSALSSIGIV